MTPTRSESQADMMVGTFPKNYNIGPSIAGKVDVMANTPSRKTYYCSILIEESWPPSHEDFVGFTSVVNPYGFLSFRSPTFYLMF